MVESEKERGDKQKGTLDITCMNSTGEVGVRRYGSDDDDVRKSERAGSIVRSGRHQKAPSYLAWMPLVFPPLTPLACMHQ